MEDIELVRQLAITTPFSYEDVRYSYFECLDRWPVSEACQKLEQIIYVSLQRAISPLIILDLIPKSSDVDLRHQASLHKIEFISRASV